MRSCIYLSQNKTVTLTCKTLEISKQSYYRWRREHGGMEELTLFRIWALNMNPIYAIPSLGLYNPADVY
jgi:hypothetical protein